MESQQAIFQALIDGKIIKHNAGIYYKLQDGRVVTSKNKLTDYVSASCAFNHFGEYEICLDTKEILQTIRGKMCELQTLISYYYNNERKMEE
jgi:hypothetical protein